MTDRQPSDLRSVIGFLRSVVRSGEQLSAEDEAMIDKALAAAIRAAEAQARTEQDALWRAAVLASQHGGTHHDGCPCAPLRALLATFPAQATEP